ncbi:MAG: DUF4140 domain-containing protein, partial [Bacteroidetes bacterium]|nr:DUF4140 domain-containing protein [Bacteroidota bacterium]
MINKLILSALILTTFFQKGFASGTPINSDIKEVTVFLHGAQVTRQAQFSLTAGTSELVFEGLSNDIDENSIEVKGSGSGVIMSVNYRINYIRLKQKSSDEKHLQGMLDSAKLKLEGIQNEIASLTQQLDLMAANYKLGVNEKSNFIEDIDDWADLYKKRTTDIRNKISRLRIAERDAVSNMKNVQEQVDATQAANKVPSGEVIVKVSAANSGVVYFTLRYFVQ